MELNLTDIYPKEECKGIVARYKESIFKRNNGSYVHIQEFTPLKRESCPGCEYCMGIHDTLGEDYSNGFPIQHRRLRNGDKVELILIVTGTDWETGYADDWHIEARRISD